MLEFRGQHPEFSIGLLSFTLEYVLVSNWPNNVLLKGYNSCDLSCTPGQAEPCGCSCATNFFDDWSDEQVSVQKRSLVLTRARKDAGWVSLGFPFDTKRRSFGRERGIAG